MHSNFYSTKNILNQRTIRNTPDRRILTSGGGNTKKWREIKPAVTPYFSKNQHPTIGEDLVKNRDAYSKEINVRVTENPIRPRIINPEDYKTVDELLDACEVWWIYRKRNRRTTWRKYRNLLKDMADHPIFPVNFFNPNPDQVVAYLDLKENNCPPDPNNPNEKKGLHGVIRSYNAFKVLMRATNRHEFIEKLNYFPPKRPKAKPRLIPHPEIAYKLMHYRYSNNRYENALYQHLFTFCLFVGMRPSSELPLMKIENMDLTTGIFTYYQPKTKTWRDVVLEKELVSYSNRKSMKNWIECWLPKVDNPEGYLFPRPDGQPFTENSIRSALEKMGKKVWSKYYTYSSRHFCVTARMIQNKINHGSFDIKEVCDYMGHSGTDITDDYTKQVKKWIQIAPYDWFRALLKYHPAGKQGLQKKSVKTGKTRITAASEQNPFCKAERTRRDSNPRPLA